jgi:predicted permease
VSWHGALVSRLRALFARKRLDHELDEEIRFHLEMQAEDNCQAGMDPVEARRAAMRSFGGVERMKEQYRERRTLHLIDTILQDIRYAMRAMRKSPGLTLVAVLSLAIGVGANTAVFSFADGLLLRPLAVPRPGDLLILGWIDLFGESVESSYRDYIDVRDRSKTFERLAAFTSQPVAFAVNSGDVPRLRIGNLVSANFFETVGVAPEFGRDFRPEEDVVPGRDAVVILGHDFWLEQFGGDRAVLGRTVRLNGVEFTIIGVAPAGFTGLEQYARYEFYAPLMMWPRITDPNLRPLESRDLRLTTIRGRLKAGVTQAQAQSELSVIARDLERTYSETNRNRSIAVRTELQDRISNAPPILRLVTMLLTLSGAVLLVACANVAGLLASRAPTRAREIALRRAIGAGRGRVVRQMITESTIVACAGGMIGIGLGYVAMMMFKQIQMPTDLPVVINFGLNGRVLIVSLVAALSSAFLFGLLPAIRSSRSDLTAVMKVADAAGLGRRRFGRALLVSGQVAISVVLLVVATLIYGGFQQHITNGPGYRTDHLLTMRLNPGLARYNEVQAQQFFEQVAERARLVPGVRSVGWTARMPMDGNVAFAIVPEGFQLPDGQRNIPISGAVVDEGYFETMDLPLVKGRGFRKSDSSAAPRVAVVNETFVERYWPGQNPVGKRFRLNDGGGPWVEIVGVARDAKYSFLIESPRSYIFIPYRQSPQPAMSLLVESHGDPSTLAIPLRDMVRSLNPNQPVFNVRTMEEFYRMRTIVILNVITGLIGAMGMMGLALAIVGLYGLVAYAVSLRTREIGIRLAIGAKRSEVLRMVLRQGMALAVAGLAAGLLASVGARYGLRAVFRGDVAFNAWDMAPFALVAAAVLAVTILASYIPARRAARVSPTIALRYE